MTAARRLVSVIDDDESVRESLPDLLGELGFAARAFASGEAFLASDSIDRTECMVVDVAMPGMSGFDLVRRVAQDGRDIPVVFITAQASEGIRSSALELGAAECLLKPFSDTAMLHALDAAFRHERQR